MHDVLEDSFIQKTYLEKLFGKEIVGIVDGVSNLNKLDFVNIEERNANNLQNGLSYVKRHSSNNCKIMRPTP